MVLPSVASRAEWLASRKELLVKEKENTKARDAVNTARRLLPMVRIEKDYVFEGRQGKRALPDLFDGRRQLLVRHVMFGPDWDEPCPGCAGAIGLYTPALFEALATRETTLVLVSRAPMVKIAEAQLKHGWYLPWYSSHGGDFNFDFQVSLDASVPQVEYNYREELDLLDQERSVEAPGFSAFLRTEGEHGPEVFHTYSTYARGMDYAEFVYPMLDWTALGRQEAWEEPKGRADTDRRDDIGFEG